MAWFCKDPNKVNLVNKFAAPSEEHWFGTDALGRDSVRPYSVRWASFHPRRFDATAVSVAIGIIYGAISGFIGGKTDAVLMRIVDTLLAIPFLVLVIVLQATLSNFSGEVTQWIVDRLGLGQAIHKPSDQRSPPLLRAWTLGLAYPLPYSEGPGACHKGA